MEGKFLIQEYPYSWLDEVVEVTLNPERTKVTEFQFEQLETIERKFSQELLNVLNNLKKNTFYLFSSKKISAMVNQYNDALLLLEQQAMKNLAAYPEDHPLAATGENIIFYIQDIGLSFKRRYGKYIIDSTPDKALIEPKQTVMAKLLCRLSVDQIGIILKAADETKIILASSMSLIFRSIVPYLSTEKVSNMSWNSMRKSTYRMEQMDKDTAIATLEKLISKIKSY